MSRFGERILRTEIVVVGSGFAGTILARVLAEQGREVVLVEEGRHPRFALGESSTPLANLSLERLADRYGLPDLHSLAAYGRWSRDLPRVRRGLKRGFTFYLHRPDEAWGGERLLVAASPEDALADSHWLRSDVDHHLVERARAEGIEVLEETRLRGVDFTPEVRLVGEGPGGGVRIEAEFLVDASGGRGFLATQLPIPDVPCALASGLLYGHFEGARDFLEVGLRTASAAGRDFPVGPYPDDRAAVHHLLEEGWMYQLPFDSEPSSARLVSAGFLLEGGHPAAAQLWQIPPEEAWDALLARYPSLAEQWAGAEPVRPVEGIRRLQYWRRHAVDSGEQRWLLLPHAYAFLDPIYSTGMAWSLLGVERVADLLSGGGRPSPAKLARYGTLLCAEADQIERLVLGAYRARRDFRAFTAHSFLYFAAVSFEELRQRLFWEPPGVWPWKGFLGAGDPYWESRFDEALRRLGTEGEIPDGFADWVAGAIEGRNVIGLADPQRENLYPVDLDLLLYNSHLLGMSREAMEEALPRLRGG